MDPRWERTGTVLGVETKSALGSTKIDLKTGLKRDSKTAG